MQQSALFIILVSNARLAADRHRVHGMGVPHHALPGDRGDGAGPARPTLLMERRLACGLSPECAVSVARAILNAIWLEVQQDSGRGWADRPLSVRQGTFAGTRGNG